MSREFLIVDPPAGWKYGFPKVCPPDRQDDIKQWLLDEGYPEHEFNAEGHPHWIRTWYVDEDVANVEYKNKGDSDGGQYVSTEASTERVQSNRD